jgi:hypothetical protein
MGAMDEQSEARTCTGAAAGHELAGADRSAGVRLQRENTPARVSKGVRPRPSRAAQAAEVSARRTRRVGDRHGVAGTRHETAESCLSSVQRCSNLQRMRRSGNRESTGNGPEPLDPQRKEQSK